MQFCSNIPFDCGEDRAASHARSLLSAGMRTAALFPAGIVGCNASERCSILAETLLQLIASPFVQRRWHQVVYVHARRLKLRVGARHIPKPEAEYANDNEEQHPEENLKSLPDRDRFVRRINQNRLVTVSVAISERSQCSGSLVICQRDTLEMIIEQYRQGGFAVPDGQADGFAIERPNDQRFFATFHAGIGRPPSFITGNLIVVGNGENVASAIECGNLDRYWHEKRRVAQLAFDPPDAQGQEYHSNAHSAQKHGQDGQRDDPVPELIQSEAHGRQFRMVRGNNQACLIVAHMEIHEHDLDFRIVIMAVVAVDQPSFAVSEDGFSGRAPAILDITAL